MFINISLWNCQKCEKRKDFRRRGRHSLTFGPLLINRRGYSFTHQHSSNSLAQIDVIRGSDFRKQWNRTTVLIRSSFKFWITPKSMTTFRTCSESSCFYGSVFPLVSLPSFFNVTPMTFDLPLREAYPSLLFPRPTKTIFARTMLHYKTS